MTNEKVELSGNQEPVIRLTTPRCLLCGETSIVELTRDEFARLNDGAYVQDALADRDAAFQELVISGTHDACWETLMHPEGVGKV